MPEAKKEPTPHQWVYDGKGGGHRGEYDFTCMVCGATDWISGAALDRGEKPLPGVCPGAKAPGRSTGP